MKNYGAVNSDESSSSDGNVTRIGVSKEDSNGSPSILRMASAIVIFVFFVFSAAASLSSRDNSELPQDLMLGLAAAGSYDDGHDINQPFFWDDQLVNHFSNDTSTWSNRYYKSTKYFEGPGSPIFLVVGGEGALEKMLYPFITEHLAPRFGAAVIQIEHRFYGPYRPIMGREATTEELLELLTPQQAMADMVYLTKHFKDELGCSKHTRKSSKYCPVITVGGSYPGFLSAMFRLVYPDFVDISYASSAPLKLYDHTANQYSFYDIITTAAERLSPGCAKAVRDTLDDAAEAIMSLDTMEDALKSMNVCSDKLSDEIKDLASLKENTMLSVTYSFANYDMDAYPPGKDLMMYKACQVFQNGGDSLETMKNFFKFSNSENKDDGSCVPLFETEESENDDKMWDFQVCASLVNEIGQSNNSMFYPHKFVLSEFDAECQSEFGISPNPSSLADALGFRDLVAAGATRILFTNGLQDMWAGGSYLENLSDSILALNFENGAHHSDLSHAGPTGKDTDDIKAGYVQITYILAEWLDEIKAESKTS